MNAVTPVFQLVPNVIPTGDFLRYRVSSRSRKGTEHDCDMEARQGIGNCTCERYVFGKMKDCHHLNDVRRYQSIELNQRMMEQRNAVNRR